MSGSGPRVRIYSPFFPFPATEGAFQVIYDQARTLAHGGILVELVTWKDSPAEIARKLAAPAPVPFSDEIQITSLHGRRPRTGTASEWSSSSPGSVREQGGGILTRAARVARALVSGWASPELFYYPLECDARRLLPPADVGIYHYSFCYSWLRRNGSASETEVYVHLHNRESELSGLRAELERSFLSRRIHRWNAARLARHEKRIGTLADELWFLSGRDRDGWEGAGGVGRARHVPPTFHSESLAPRRRAATPAASEVEVGFLGGCDFEPNRLSLQWIVEHLAPVLEREGFGGRILVAGRGVPSELRRAAERYSFFNWLGFVPDLEDYWSRLSFFLVPHVGGSGVRIKLLEAAASGVPVLANTAALSAVADDVARHPLMLGSDDPEEWARWILAEEEGRATRRRLAGESFAGTSLDGAKTYEFLLRSLQAERTTAAIEPGG